MRTAPTLLVLWIALGTGLPARAQDVPAALQPTFEAGILALKGGKLDEAEKAFREVIAKGGSSPYVHNNLGIVLQERAEHSGAVAEFREAMRLDPAYAAPRILLGASLLALDRVPEARAELRKAVKLAPREPLARLQLARIDEQAGDWAAAVEQYRALRELNPDDPEYMYGLGSAYLGLSEWCLRQLRGLDGGAARLYQMQGHNLRVQGRPDLALLAFERAAKADPALPEVHLVMAQIHMEQKRWAEARREIERELLVSPESAGARALRERLLSMEGGSR